MAPDAPTEMSVGWIDDERHRSARHAAHGEHGGEPCAADDVFEDRTGKEQRDAVEGDVHKPAMQERRGEQAPPLAAFEHKALVESAERDQRFNAGVQEPAFRADAEDIFAREGRQKEREKAISQKERAMLGHCRRRLWHEFGVAEARLVHKAPQEGAHPAADEAGRWPKSPARSCRAQRPRFSPSKKASGFSTGRGGLSPLLAPVPRPFSITVMKTGSFL